MRQLDALPAAIVSILAYQSRRLSALLTTHYYCPESELKQYKEAVEENLNLYPVHSVNEAVLRIQEVTGVARKPT